jgi:hypothetical protein
MNEQPQKECYSLRLHLYDRFGNSKAAKAYTKVKQVQKRVGARLYLPARRFQSHLIRNKH